MNKLLLTTLMSIALSHTAMANEENKAAGKENSKSEAAQKAEVVPMGFVIIEEQVSIDMKALPLALMDEAFTDFSEKNYGEATGSLRAAARVIRSSGEAATMGESERKQLVGRIEKLAADVRGTTIKSEAEFKARLAEIAYLKAGYNRALASKEWDKRQLKRAGHDLDASVTALNYAEKWGGKTFAKDTKTSISRAQDIARKLIDGTGWTEADVSSALAQLEASVTKVGSMVSPSRAKAADEPDSKL